MAPRKNDENTARKAPRKRIVKLKAEVPKNNPSVLKVKIPIKSFDQNNIITKPNKKQLFEQKQLELANEVALAQFKQPDLTGDPLQLSLLAPEVEPIPEKKPTLAKGKRKAPVKETKPKRSKKDAVKEEPVELTTELVQPEKELQVTIPIKKTTKKPVVKRSPAKSTVKELPPSTNDETTETPKQVTKKPRGRQKVPANSNVSLVEKEDTPKANAKKCITDEKPTSEPTKNTNSTPNGTRASTRSTRKKMAPKRYEAKPADMTTSDTQKTTGKADTISRKSSANSIGSRLSWTQDMSTSSATTCYTVTSNDFVRIDKKLPVVPLIHVVPVKNTVSESSTSSSSSNCSSCSSSSDSENEDTNRRMGDDEYDRMEVESEVARDLNLSTSTSAVSEACRQISLPPNKKHIDIDAIAALVDQLPSCLNGINKLLDNRLAGIVRPEMASDIAIEEIDVIKICRTLFPVRPASEEPFVRPAPRRRRSERPDPKKIQEKPLPPPEKPAVIEKPREDVASEHVHYNSFEHEDDDALSLFAESITGIESSRMSSALDEYVPAPIVPSFAPRRYRPTKIGPRRSTVEKHSADSTSVKDASVARIQYPEPQYEEEQYPEIDQELAVQQPMEHFLQRQHSQEKPDIPPLKQSSSFLETQSSQSAVQQSVKHQDNNNFAVPSVLYRPPLASRSLSDVIPPPQGQSLFFRGICILYLFSNKCRYDPCRYIHSEPNRDEMRNTLRGLKDEVLLRELALVWQYPTLRRSYAGIFVQELVARGITRAMMEVLERAVEEKHPLETAVTEAVLLHLNSVDLMEVQDTLKPSVCVELLSTLANTQNFSRFRAVFAKLSQFVAEKRQIVPLEVTLKILERVCILPCEENLARAMLALIKQTDPSIYDSEQMPTFEMHLEMIGGLVHEEYFLEKGRERKSPTLEPEQQERYTSPDTTHYDNLNQLPISPRITRTVDLKRSRTDTTVVTYDSNRPTPNQNKFEWYQRKYPRLQRPVGPRPLMGLNGSPMRHHGPHLMTPNGPLLMRPNGPRHFRPMNVPMNNIRRTIKRRPVEMSYGQKQNYQRSSGDYYY